MTKRTLDRGPSQTLAAASPHRHYSGGERACAQGWEKIKVQTTSAAAISKATFEPSPLDERRRRSQLVASHSVRPSLKWSQGTGQAWEFPAGCELRTEFSFYFSLPSCLHRWVSSLGVAEIDGFSKVKTVRKAKNSWSETVITAAEDSESRAGWKRNTACVKFLRACGARQRELKELAVRLFGSRRVLDTFNFPEFNCVCFGGEREKQLQCKR